MSAQDSMRFRKRYQLDANFGDWSTWRIGCYDFLATNTTTLPMGTYFYEVEIRRSGSLSALNYTFYIPETGQSNFDIFY